MSATYVMTVRKGERSYSYHRRPGFRLIPVSAGVDIRDRQAVEFDFAEQSGAFPKRADPQAAKRRAEAKSALREMLRKAVHRSRSRATDIGRDCEITLDYVLDMYEAQEGRCAVSGLKFDPHPSRDGRANPFRPSIDRIDCAKGYTPDNVRLVLVAVNCGRADFPDETYIQICRAVARTYQKRCKPNLHLSDQGDTGKTKGLEINVL